MIQSLSFPTLDHKGGTWNFEFPTHPSGPPRLYIKQRGKLGFPIPSWYLSKIRGLLDRRRDQDLRRKQQRRPSYRRRLPLLRAAAFLFYERRPSSATSLKLQGGSNLLICRLPRGSRWRPQICNSCAEHRLKAQGRAGKSRRHSTVAPSSHPIRQVCDLLPVLIDSIRFLPHALWLSIILFHVWVILDLLCPIARVC
jgi:hypothetical protein